MKKLKFLLIFFLVGCSNKVNLTCSYVDYSNLYGTRKIVDVLTLKDDNLVSFSRNINVTLYNNIDNKNIFKILKLEGKTFKNVVGGKYKLINNSNSIELRLSMNNFSNNSLSYMGINSSDGYDDIKSFYVNMGFSCK